MGRKTDVEILIMDGLTLNYQDLIVNSPLWLLHISL